MSLHASNPRRRLAACLMRSGSTDRAKCPPPSPPPTILEAAGGRARRERVGLRGGPVLGAEQAEVRGREQLVEGIQARILALVELGVAQVRCARGRTRRLGARGAAAEGAARPRACRLAQAAARQRICDNLVIRASPRSHSFPPQPKISERPTKRQARLPGAWAPHRRRWHPCSSPLPSQGPAKQPGAYACRRAWARYGSGPPG